MIFNILRNIASTIIWLFEIMIIARAVCSWIPSLYQSKLNSFLLQMTEPIVAPIRNLLYRVSFLRQLPIDFSPLVAIMLLGVLQAIL